jgi:hypothetical protein
MHGRQDWGLLTTQQYVRACCIAIWLLADSGSPSTGIPLRQLPVDWVPVTNATPAQHLHDAMQLMQPHCTTHHPAGSSHVAGKDSRLRELCVVMDRSYLSLHSVSC